MLIPTHKTPAHEPVVYAKTDEKLTGQSEEKTPAADNKTDKLYKIKDKNIIAGHFSAEDISTILKDEYTKK